MELTLITHMSHKVLRTDQLLLNGFHKIILTMFILHKKEHIMEHLYNLLLLKKYNFWDRQAQWGIGINKFELIT